MDRMSKRPSPLARMVRHGVSLVALVLAVLAPLPAAAEETATMSFYFKNQSGRDLAAELYSQDRRAVWPGSDKVYFLEMSQNKAIPIDCRPGERICWGAWVNGNDRITYGVGIDNRYACEDCCTICVGSDVKTVLIDMPNGAMRILAAVLAVVLALSACATRRVPPAEDASPRVPAGVTPLTTEQDRALAE